MSAKRKYNRHGRLLYSCSHCGNAKPGFSFKQNLAKVGPDWKRQPVCDGCWLKVHPHPTEDLPFTIVESYQVYDAPAPGCAGKRFIHYRAIFPNYPELRGWIADATEAEVEAMLKRVCSSTIRKRCRPADSNYYIPSDETDPASAYVGRSPAHV